MRQHHQRDLDACAREWAALRPAALAALVEERLRVSPGDATEGLLHRERRLVSRQRLWHVRLFSS